MSEPIETSATRRARAASSRAAPPPERQPAQWRVRTCHAKAGCALEAAAGTWHHVLRRSRETFRCHGLLYSAWADHNQRGTAPSRGRSRAALPPKRRAVQWSARTCHAKAGCSWHVSPHGLAPKERGVPQVQCSFTVPEPVATSAARRAHTARWRAAPSPERQPAQRRVRACHAKAGCGLEAAAGTSHHGLAPTEGGLPPVKCPVTLRGPTAISAAWRARASSSRAAPPLERQAAQWRVRKCHAKAGCGLEGAASTSHHGLVTKERGVPPVQGPFAVPEPVTTSATRRARAESSRAAPPPERQPAQWRANTCHTKAGCGLEAAADTSHHGLTTKE